VVITHSHRPAIYGLGGFYISYKTRPAYVPQSHEDSSNECGVCRRGLVLGRPGGRNLPRLCCLHCPPWFLSPSDVRGCLLTGAKGSGEGKIPLKFQRCGRVMEGVRTVQHERLTIQEAAYRLGVSESAIRKRIKRGTLKREKTEDGRVLIYMEPSAPGTEEVRTSERDALISQMQERLAFLENELEVRSEEIRRRDTIIMNMTEAMKALNPPTPEDSSEARESPESSGPTSGRGEVWEELDTERARREMAESALREGMAEEQRRREEAEQERDDLRRELDAHREARESPQTVEEEPERAEPRPTTVKSQEGVQRPWWRRVFGG
jgi:hypothetical protein